jgi:predicted lipid-binding transport protein (Tim44 family)
MPSFLDVPTVLVIALAIVIVLRLFSVLGRKTGSERPVDPLRRMDRGRVTDGGPVATAARDNVVPIPRQGTPDSAAPAPSDPALPPEDRVKGSAFTGSPAASGLLDIARADPAFEARHFVNGARSAYEMIVIAYAEGNRRLLKSLTSKDVFDGFMQAVTEREEQGQTNETHFIGIISSDLTEAELRDAMARVTVKFRSQLITLIRDRAGTIISGDPKEVREVTDVWTFAREVTSKDPNWKLVATQSAH